MTDPDRQERFQTTAASPETDAVYDAGRDLPLPDPNRQERVLVRGAEQERERDELQERLTRAEQANHKLRKELDLYHERIRRIAGLARQPFDPAVLEEE